MLVGELRWRKGGKARCRLHRSHAALARGPLERRQAGEEDGGELSYARVCLAARIARVGALVLSFEKSCGGEAWFLDSTSIYHAIPAYKVFSSYIKVWELAISVLQYKVVRSCYLNGVQLVLGLKRLVVSDGYKLHDHWSLKTPWYECFGDERAT